MKITEQSKTTLFRIFAVVCLIAGITLLGYGVIEYFISVSNSTTPIGVFDRPLLITYSSFPLLLLGFFFYVLGWGKKK